MSTPLDLAATWLQLDRDNDTRREIQALVDDGNLQELSARLSKRIAFGTAGLRASMKAGFAHMNSLTVLQASHGLAAYVSEVSQDLGAVIGYDGRYNSEKFARLTAAAFLSRGFKIYWLGMVHTPMVPFSVSFYRASVGVMITASHNPKNDNGYKVYWSNGSQIVPPHDIKIAAAIEQVQAVDTWDTTLLDRHPNVSKVYDIAVAKYIDTVRSLVPSIESNLPFTYTPMHGVGLPFMTKIASQLGISHALQVVQAQAAPDPDFPTVPFPNPEEKGALTPAVQDANRHGTSMIVANDPDADRFAAAERSGTTWHQFTGNEMGALLASYVYETYQGDKSKMIMLASTVSSRMLSAMAAKLGFHFKETLTGFKWLGNVAQDLLNEGLQPVFAYEEAIGYMFPSVVWDKDGIAAATVFLAARQHWHEQGKTPLERLNELQGEIGSFADANTYLVSPSPETTASVFTAIRGTAPPEHVGRRRILRWRDLTTGFDTASADGKPDLPVDASAQMITCELEGDVVFTARGSGTEPKIKLYIEAKSSSGARDAQVIAQDVLADLLKEWFKPEYNLRLAGT